MPAGPLEDAGGDARGGQQGPHPFQVEWTERDALQPPLALKRLQHALESLLRRRGGDHQHGRRGTRRRPGGTRLQQSPEPLEGPRVGPVQVVQQHHGRPKTAHRRQRLDGVGEEALPGEDVARLAVVVDDALVLVPEPMAAVAAPKAGRRIEVGAHLTQPAHRAADHLRHGFERRGGGAPGLQRETASQDVLASKRLEQPGLASASGAGDEEQPGGPFVGARGGREQAAQLAAARRSLRFDDRIRCHGRPQGAAHRTLHQRGSVGSWGRAVKAGHSARVPCKPRAAFGMAKVLAISAKSDGLDPGRRDEPGWRPCRIRRQGAYRDALLTPSAASGTPAGRRRAGRMARTAF